MQTSIAINVEQTLDDLASSSFPAVRRGAAHKLGQLTVSNAKIVQALVAADVLDEDASVRGAVRQALASPAHQNFLQQNPDFIQTATEAAQQRQADVSATKESRIMEEFIARRSHYRRNLLIYFGCIIVAVILLFLAAIQSSNGLVCIFQIFPILFGILMFLQSQRIWRCPACDNALADWSVQVNPWFASAPLKCPNCGAKLL